MHAVHYRAADIGGLKISYREAGPANAPTLLLMHGFPDGRAHVPRSDPAARGQLSPGSA